MRYWLIPCLAAFLLHSTPSGLTGGGLADYRLDTADQTRLTASTAGYTLEVELKPYCLVLRRGGEIIARNPSGGGAAFYRKGSALKLEAVTSWLDTGEGLSLTVATSAPGFQAQVRLTLFTDNVLVRYATGDEQNCERIEESYELAASGHWYGGNVTSGHHWPLETAALELDPFLATSNQTTPFWLTSAGAGFYVPTWQPMGFSIGKGGDGLFRFNL
ncbi:MAG: hypothetical protein V1794_17925, partial [Candidatus Glassbacteria bacterium]